MRCTPSWILRHWKPKWRPFMRDGDCLSDPFPATVRVTTHAVDRASYLRNPESGRALDDASREKLTAFANGNPLPPSPGTPGEGRGEGSAQLMGDDHLARIARNPHSSPLPEYREREVAGAQFDTPARPDLAIIVADGLSAAAAPLYAVPLLTALLPLLRSAGLSIAPLVLARFARVALQDDVATALRARGSIILLGERPGLHVPVSLGAYFVYDPKVGTTDERRNCVSSIHARGLSPHAAAQTLFYLVTESFRRQISGVMLKDDRGTPLLEG